MPMQDPLEPHQRNVHRPVLVLNQNYEPLNVCNVRRALTLVFGEKAEVLEVYDAPVTSATRSFTAPSVIRLIYLIRRPRPRVKLTRREVFIRDEHTCQYCGVRTNDLTIDHIIPRSRGGQHTWENLVSACRACNHRKGGKSLPETRMRLRREPFEPRAGAYYTIQRRLNASISDDWRRFIPGYEAIPETFGVSSSSD
ncbi:MAG: HNH endonuclease [Chloroflexi bacterium]|nr:MAG: HNH endonuclease [Chloroflexota bacterium]